MSTLNTDEQAELRRFLEGGFRAASFDGKPDNPSHKKDQPEHRSVTVYFDPNVTVRNILKFAEGIGEPDLEGDAIYVGWDKSGDGPLFEDYKIQPERMGELVARAHRDPSVNMVTVFSPDADDENIILYHKPGAPVHKSLLRDPDTQPGDTTYRFGKDRRRFRSLRIDSQD